MGRAGVLSTIRAGRFARWALLAPLVALAACEGPKVGASRAMGRGVIVENQDRKAFRIDRLIANDSPENSNCNNYPGRTLAPGDTYTAVFWACGTITRIDVVADRGTSSLTWE